jgi:predicted RNase H-like HicB family nuclease
LQNTVTGKARPLWVLVILAIDPIFRLRIFGVISTVSRVERSTDKHTMKAALRKVKGKGKKVKNALWLTCRFSRENGGYVVRCLELDVTTQGDTFEEAQENIVEAVELYLETYGLPEELRSSDSKPVLMPIEVPV